MEDDLNMMIEQVGGIECPECPIVDGRQVGGRTAYALREHAMTCALNTKYGSGQSPEDQAHIKAFLESDVIKKIEHLIARYELKKDYLEEVKVTAIEL